MSKVPSIRTWVKSSGAEDDYIDVHLDEEYMRQVYARLESVAQSLLQQPAAHKCWFRKLSILLTSIITCDIRHSTQRSCFWGSFVTPIFEGRGGHRGSAVSSKERSWFPIDRLSIALSLTIRTQFAVEYAQQGWVNFGKIWGGRS